VIDVELPPVIGRAYDVWVRIKSLDDRPCEVTGYRYEAFVEGDNRTTAEGASHYVAVLFAPPDLGLGIDDVGELSPDGRREVKLVVQNGRERLHLGCRVMVERGDGGSASSEEHSEWMDPGSKRRLYLSYDVEGTGPYVLRILGRDISSGRLLFSLAVPTPDGRASAGERLPEESAQAGAAPE
jgi:hypothetical protein